MNRKVVITGVAGFIGRGLAEKLRENDDHISGVDFAPHCPGLHSYAQANLTDPGPWMTLFRGADIVFHLAGKVHALSEVDGDKDEYFRANTEATRNVLEAARQHGVKRLVFFSTVKAMTRDDQNVAFDTYGLARPWTENDHREPDTPYGQSKLAAEQLVLSGGFVPEPVILRLCMVYGRGAKGNITKMLQAIQQHRFPPPPRIPNRRSMVHVQDVIQAALLSSFQPEAKGQVFIVSDGLEYSTRTIYELAMAALGRSVPSWHTPLIVLSALAKAGDLVGRFRGKRFAFDSNSLEKLTGNAWFSSDKIQRTLGFKAQRSLETSIPEMLSSIPARATT